MGSDHPGYCRKEKEIAEMQADLKTLKRFVMGNGQEGLAVTVPKLNRSVDELQVSVKNLDRNVGKVIALQDHYAGEKDGKAEIRKRTRWLIGILSGVILSLIAGLIATIHLLAQ